MDEKTLNEFRSAMWLVQVGLVLKDAIELFADDLDFEYGLMIAKDVARAVLRVAEPDQDPVANTRAEVIALLERAVQGIREMLRGSDANYLRMLDEVPEPSGYSRAWATRGSAE